jgi:hypothetical protein
MALIVRRLHHTMDRGLEKTSGQEFEGFSKIDDQSFWYMLHPFVNPVVVVKDLES